MVITRNIYMKKPVECNSAIQLYVEHYMKRSVPMFMRVCKETPVRNPSGVTGKCKFQVLVL